MLKEIEFIRDHRVFSTGDKLTFRPGINLLVGDQGCGKSTLLQTIRDDGMSRKDQVAKLTVEQGTASWFLDFEKGTLRTMDINTAAAKGMNTLSKVAHLWCSHGESVNAVLQGMPTEKGVMLIDEPDMALSIRSIHRLYEQLAANVAHDQQIILSCHNPYLMELVGPVLSIEHKRWMHYSEFKGTQV